MDYNIGNNLNGNYGSLNNYNSLTDYNSNHFLENKVDNQYMISNTNSYGGNVTTFNYK